MKLLLKIKSLLPKRRSNELSDFSEFANLEDGEVDQEIEGQLEKPNKRANRRAEAITEEPTLQPLETLEKTAQNGDLAQIKGVWYASNLPDLRKVLATTKRPKLVLRGDLIFCTLDATNNPSADYVKQDPRLGAPTLKALVTQTSKERVAFVSVRKEAIELLQNHSVKKLTLEFDQLLHFGTKKNSKIIVMTSFTLRHDTLVQMIVFSDGFLQEINEQRFATSRLEIGVRTVVTELRKKFPQHEMTWVDPSGEAPLELPRGVRMDGAKAFAKPIYKRLVGADNQLTYRSQFKKPLLIVGASAIAYAGLIAMPFQAYSDEKDGYTTRMNEFKASSTREIGGLVQPSQLTVFEKRRFFMTDPRAQTKMMSLTTNIIKEINKIQPKIWITDLKVGTFDEKTDGITLVFRTIKEPGSTGTAQVEPIVHSLTEALGTSFSMTNQGIIDVSEEGKTYRSVTLSGRIGA